LLKADPAFASDSRAFDLDSDFGGIFLLAFSAFL